VGLPTRGVGRGGWKKKSKETKKSVTKRIQRNEWGLLGKKTIRVENHQGQPGNLFDFGQNDTGKTTQRKKKTSKEVIRGTES